MMSSSDLSREITFLSCTMDASYGGLMAAHSCRPDWGYWLKKIEWGYRAVDMSSRCLETLGSMCTITCTIAQKCMLICSTKKKWHYECTSTNDMDTSLHINLRICKRHMDEYLNMHRPRLCAHPHTCTHRFGPGSLEMWRRKWSKKSQEGFHADSHSTALRQSAASLLFARELSSCGHKGQGGEGERETHLSVCRIPPPTTWGGSSFSNPFH